MPVTCGAYEVNEPGDRVIGLQALPSTSLRLHQERRKAGKAIERIEALDTLIPLADFMIDRRQERQCHVRSTGQGADEEVTIRLRHFEVQPCQSGYVQRGAEIRPQLRLWADFSSE